MGSSSAGAGHGYELSRSGRQQPGRGRKHKLPVSFLVIALMVVAVLLGSVLVVLLDPDAGRVRVTFMNTAGEDLILIRTPDRRHLLIGTGITPDAAARSLDSRLPAWTRTIDLLIITDNSSLHLSGAMGLVERYQVRSVIEAAAETNSTIEQDWRTLLATHGITHTTAEAGQEIEIGAGLLLEVLDVSGGRTVLHMGYRDGSGASILFAGDADAEIEAVLVQQRAAELPATLLHIPGHGSWSAYNPEFMELVHPRIAIISPGPVIFGKAWSGPDEEVVSKASELGTDLIRFDQAGSSPTVIFSADRRLLVRYE